MSGGPLEDPGAAGISVVGISRWAASERRSHMPSPWVVLAGLYEVPRLECQEIGPNADQTISSNFRFGTKPSGQDAGTETGEIVPLVERDATG